ncbi:MAG TPA: transcriptional regulator [Acidimicrobiia bacterium]|nr:transcriptional regulator [Acidimicrobiia bacterium]
MKKEADPTRPRDDVASLGSLGDPTRRALYDFVCRQAAPAGRDEAAAAAGVGRTLAAYHLDRMVEDGLLEVSFARRTGRSGPGAGRPAKLYWRASRQFKVSLPPRDYELAARIFADAIETEPTGRARAALQESAQGFGAEVAAEVERLMVGRPDAERVAVLEQVLAERGYEPFRDEAGVVRLRNCPFDCLADAHREIVCGMNLALLERAAHFPGSRLEAVLDPRPDLCCVALLPSGEKRNRRRPAAC